MIHYIIKKLLVFPLVIITVSLIIFAVLRFIPGDPARLMAGKQATQEAVEQMRERLGLNQHFFVQYGKFLKNAVKGDLGVSIRSEKTVISILGKSFPNTFKLVIVSYVIAVLIGVIAGILAAIYQYSWIDQLVMFLAILGASTANFWVALMGMNLFAVKLGWLPLLGTGSWKHFILPALSLAWYPTALIARMSRSSMLEVIRQDYIKTARAKGLNEFMVYIKHALRNALIPIVTVIGLHFGVLLAGAVVTETVFIWPGLGRLLVDAVRYRDYPLIQGSVLLSVTSVVTVNFVVDLLITQINPRLKFD